MSVELGIWKTLPRGVIWDGVLKDGKTGITWVMSLIGADEYWVRGFVQHADGWLHVGGSGNAAAGIKLKVTSISGAYGKMVVAGSFISHPQWKGRGVYTSYHDAIIKTFHVKIWQNGDPGYGHGNTRRSGPLRLNAKQQYFFNRGWKLHKHNQKDTFYRAEVRPEWSAATGW
ncbi:hypothetical protein [Teredinibacter sp. KSP-S5-2]|uniref:hypothetical protein n=1 Tax=Teredinibacter sp. KSP-S5-2 TaxID=3034506 RepID=UPI00293469CD|nr:hypothetical protein [Teredinibacter sp. KSP-S5-2]WNO08830.1 hypothetical protein P5V12_17810 [Teredinibacter sp. KSP-S5-2]